MRLAEKSIVVIGGTSGIGFSAVRAMLREGARVVVVGRDCPAADEATASLSSESSADRFYTIRGDASQADTSVRAIEAAISRFGAFDGLYHVAGGSGRRFGDGPLHELSDQGIEYTLQQNLASVLYSNRAAVHRFLKDGRGGSVLNLASVLAYSPAATHFSTVTYAAAKAGIIGLTRCSAASYAKNNIRFNALAPGLVNTPMAQRAVQDSLIQQFIVNKQPLDGGRVGKPEDLDGATVFLLSDEAAFVTGQVLAVDGGWTISDNSGAAGHQQ